MINENTLKAMRGALFIRRQSLKDDDPATRANVDALALVDALLAGDTIASLWSLEDVYSLIDDDDDRDAVTEDEAREVLRFADSEHDASVGINWDVLNHWLDYVRSNA